MTGSIRCNRCGVSISEKSGACPKCGRAQCHINLYHHGRVYKFFKDTRNIIFSYMSAIDQLLAMNREIRSRTFKADIWKPGTIKERRLDQSVNRWLEQKKTEVESLELSPGTYHAYKSRIDFHILNKEYGLGSWDIREISFAELEQFKDSLPKTIKIKTRREIVNTLHTFFKWAWRKGLVPIVPPFPVVKGTDSMNRIALSIEDQYEALSKIPGQYRDVFEFEFETGVRPGETCALKIKDIDFETRTMKVERTFTMRQLRESDKEGHRKPVPLSDRAFEIAKKNAAVRFPEDWLFVHPRTKKHYTVHRLELYWKEYTKLPCTHYEGTRHSFCTQISEIDDKKAAQDLMRHADSRSTDRYIHSGTEYLRDALKKRGEVVELKRKKQ
jgi:integrase